MMKKIGLWSILVVLISFVLGCGHKHTWKDATCTEPRTCTQCGETEGEILNHTWKKATCENPEICTVCGETKGEAIGHTTDMGICTICGEMVNYDQLLV